MMRLNRILSASVILLAIIFLFGCYPALRKEAQRPEDALSKIRFFYPTFHDDMDFDSLILAVTRNLEYLDRIDPGETFQYGSDRYTCQQIRESQETLLRIIKENPDQDQLDRKIRALFRVYRATGRVGNNKVLFTGYFEPTFEASLTRNETFRYPIYREPDDLVKINLSLFNEKFRGERIIARIDGKSVLPYYSRRHIEIDKVLKGQGLEIAWLKDPLDVAFLHIQGSGRLELPDGRIICVGYQTSNGRPYRSIGRYMIENRLLNSEDMSMQNIRRYLSEHPEIIDEVLNHNPSYVFFRVLEKGPLGSINVPLTPGRSLALDSRLFPKGALAFVSCQKPIVDCNGQIKEWSKFSRFVLNQDTGGAIRGAGRADLFWGNDPYAEIAAGHLKHDGELYILIKKP